MKLVWSPETAAKAYIDTVRSCELFQDSGVAELISAMAAGWDAKFIVETWSKGGVMATSIGLAIASKHTDGRHVCIVPDEGSRSEYAEAMEGLLELGGIVIRMPEIIIGEAEEVMMMMDMDGVDFMVVDSRKKDFAQVLRVARLGSRGAVLVCKNANSRNCPSFRWRNVVGDGPRRVVRSVFLPVGKGLDIAHVAAAPAAAPANNGNSGSSKSGSGKRRWIKHFDQKSGEEFVFRR